MARNVFGKELECCCTSPMTGWHRDGFCRSDGADAGRHVVCAEIDAPFLEYTRSQGNDLSKPRVEFDFPGLVPKDRWCLCVERWKEAMNAGKAPRIHLEATHESALDHVDLETLQQFAVVKA